MSFLEMRFWRCDRCQNGVLLDAHAVPDKCVCEQLVVDAKNPQVTVKLEQPAEPPKPKTRVHDFESDPAQSDVCLRCGANSNIHAQSMAQLAAYEETGLLGAASAATTHEHVNPNEQPAPQAPIGGWGNVGRADEVNHAAQFQPVVTPADADHRPQLPFTPPSTKPDG